MSVVEAFTLTVLPKPIWLPYEVAWIVAALVGVIIFSPASASINALRTLVSGVPHRPSAGIPAALAAAAYAEFNTTLFFASVTNFG